MQTERLRTIAEVCAFVQGTEGVDYHRSDRASAYECVSRTLSRFGYHGLRRRERGCVRRYLHKLTGFSAAQLTRLIAQQVRCATAVLPTADAPLRGVIREPM